MEAVLRKNCEMSPIVVRSFHGRVGLGGSGTARPVTPACGSGGFMVVLRALEWPRPRDLGRICCMGGVWSRVGLYIPILYHVVVPRC